MLQPREIHKILLAKKERERVINIIRLAEELKVNVTDLTPVIGVLQDLEMVKVYEDNTKLRLTPSGEYSNLEL